MKKILVSVGLVVLLSGCAHIAPKVVPQHHAVKRVAPPSAPPVIAPPVAAVPVPAPTPAKTFKQRWLSKFFRDRAQ